ncbi:hypothetical protein DMH04_04010 [Kibdelosporangium aridum]|uniref:ABC transporter domain-containing protein n=1 Tax=Kibdelosporangium aridum TaxID=2030 RepID=A0A428ZRF2_KIBAR|nr:ATP-binding cassette domain-containing protein [Kibdelosporangium aridum]RSM90635.1 hypothetical protein DMH04_04010 [Kibdelosporangium aridum]
MDVTALNSLVRLRNIHKRFGGVHALRDVSLQIEPGQVHAVLGENGAGKSTLIKVLTGVIQPDSGEIVLGDRPTRLHSPRAARDAGMALVPSDRRGAGRIVARLDGHATSYREILYHALP